MTSFVLNIYQYLGGMANGLNFTKTLNFNLQEQKEIKLRDLFIDNSHYLKRLSKLSYEELMKKKSLADADQEQMKSGTKPIEENFKNFVLNNKEIIIFFDEYQVAAGAYGAQEISISKDLLNDILKKEYLHKDDKNKQAMTNNEQVTLKNEQNKSSINYKKKVVALTFDDGPKSGVTNVILKELKKYKGHATFFVLGNRVKANSSLITMMVKDGHEIGNHSWNHPQLTRLSISQIKSQVNQTQTAIKKSGNVSPVYLRPPYGSVNHTVRNATTLKIALWDVDTLDWKTRNKNSIVNATLKNKVLDGKVVLMHDIYPTTSAATVSILKELHNKGYQFVTFSELEKVKRQRKYKKSG